MTRFRFILTLGMLPGLLAAATPLTGRWDLTVTARNGQKYPDWMELAESGGKTTLRIQPRSGGAKWIPDFEVKGSRLHAIFSKADAKNPEVIWDVEADG